MPLIALFPPSAPAAVEEWQIDVTTRAGVAQGSWKYSDTANTAPVMEFNGQDPLADVGVGKVTLPLTHTANSLLDQDRLLHLKVRGTRVATMCVKVPDLTIVAPNAEADEVQDWHLETLFGVLNEGVVQPPGGVGSLPAVPDRLFDWSDTGRDNSDFTVPYVLGTVDDAATNYPVTPYGEGMEFPSNVSVIGPAGFGWTGDAPQGRIYGYIDHSFAGGYYRVNGTFDNGGELRVDGKVIQSFTVGFGRAFQVPKFAITAGTHRVAFVVENGGTPGAEGPCTAAIEFVLADAGDNGTFEFGTSSSWRIMEFPANPPGMTVHEIVAKVVDENALATGALDDFTISSTPAADSNGHAWTERWDVSTKVGGTLASFLLKELCETYCDARMRYTDGDGIVLDLYNFGDRGGATAVTLARGSNIGSLKIEGAPTLATSFLVPSNIGGDLYWSRVTTTPEAGHPDKEQSLSLGAAHTSEEVTRIATQQLNLFGRKRGMTTITHLTNQSTSDGEMPGLAYWTGDTITIPTDTSLTPGVVRVIAMTWQLSPETGQLVFTPQLGDLVIPVEARPSQALRKMARPNLGGNARPAA